MPRFFKTNIEQDPALTGPDAAHAARSLRVRVGEKLIVCNTRGLDYHCAVAAVTPQRVELSILQKVPTISEPDIAVTLCPCLMKGDKLETVIRHGVELGVTAFLPLYSANCVSKPNEKALAGKLARWNKLAAEAAGQSGRGILPQVYPAVPLTQLVKELQERFDLTLFFYEAGGEPLGQLMWEHSRSEKPLKTVCVITGPEGGFTLAEAELLQAAGAKTVTLGKRILRAETAPLAAVTGLMLLTDNLE